MTLGFGDLMAGDVLSSEELTELGDCVELNGWHRAFVGEMPLGEAIKELAEARAYARGDWAVWEPVRRLTQPRGPELESPF